MAYSMHFSTCITLLSVLQLILYTGADPPALQQEAANSQAGWGAWGEWTACSRSCGGGAARQERKCLLNNEQSRAPQLLNNEVLEATATGTCRGLSKRYHECNTKPCSGPPADFRAQQCSEYDKRPFKGRYYNWLPYVDGNTPCTLHCRPRGELFYAALTSAADGTPCTRPPHRSICLQGVCKAVGGDGVLGSAAPRACGRRLVSGLFTTRALPLGYSLVATVPAGACNLTVTEMQPSDNYIALRVTGGAFVVNGAFAVSASGAYEAAGARFVYRRGARDSVLAAGPLMQPVDIMILYRHPNPGIKYSYQVSAPEEENAPPTHHPLRHRAAERRRTALQADNLPEEGSHEAPSSRESALDYNSVASEELAQSRESGGAPVRHVWRQAGFTPCTKTCGGGVQTALWRCVEAGTEHEAAEATCGAAPSARRRRCGRAACGPRWRTGLWTECPVCGPANRTRTVECVQEYNRAVNKVHISKCVGPIPVNIRECKVKDCGQNTAATTGVPPTDEPRPAPPTTQATAIDTPAKSAKERTEVESFIDSPPKFINSHNVNDSYSVQRAAEETNEINQDSKGEWLYDEWSECTATCGSGVQTRTVVCAEGACGARPDERRACASERLCHRAKPAWFAGPWTACSTTCGLARRSREVLCLLSGDAGGAGGAGATCEEEERPHEDELCALPPCAQHWFVGDWSECAGECGSGWQSRIVSCATDAGRARDCPPAARPSARRVCAPTHCSGVRNQLKIQKQYEYLSEADSGKSNGLPAGMCQDKLGSCALAVQARLCHYKYYSQLCCRSCRTAILQ